MELDLDKIANDILFQQGTSTGVVINENNEIVYFCGDTAPFLLHPNGRPDLNIFKMARKGLSLPLQDILLKVKDSQEPVERRSVIIDGTEYTVGIAKLQMPYFLILFYNNVTQNKYSNGTLQPAYFKTVGDAITIENITDLHAANIELRDINSALEQNNRELSFFTYTASHDLQDPLRKIHTFCTHVIEAEKDNISEKSLLYLERALLSASRVQQLLDDLLNYSHISNPEKGEEATLTDVNGIIEEIQLELKEVLKQKGASIKTSPIQQVQAIRSLLYQVFLNLINNALKYSRADIPSLIIISSETVAGKEIAAQGADENKNYCKITVEDNGIGFKQELAEDIFMPFRRLHSKDKYEGSGIGLAICRKIISRHKGIIKATGTPGAGAAFSIYLPL